MKSPKFLYFDLGQVLLTFDVPTICVRMAEVAGIEPRQVQEAVFDHRLQDRYERGDLTTQEYYDAFCSVTGATATSAALNRVVCDVFALRPSMQAVVGQLYRAGYRMGILSNTCDLHWEDFLKRFRMLSELFEVHALSYRLKASKPQPEIFEAAARLAGVAPEDIFFTDDVAGHVAAARAAGFDAVQFTGTRELVDEMRKRGLRFNY
jgi:FMN phosphatase YigB (HAD superfamily)